MKKFKKLISLLLAVMMVVSMTTVSVISVSAVVEDDGSEKYKYYKNSDGTVQING